MQEPEIPTPSSAPAAEATSLTSRLFNVFAAPGEVFDEVKTAPPTPANWVAPATFSIVLGIIFAFVVFSMPNVLHEIREQSDKAIAQKIAQGKMTQADADKAAPIIDKVTSPPVLKSLAIIGSIFGTFGRLFWWALVIWLLGRWIMRVQFPYMKAVEVTGLSMMIGVLGWAVTLLLVVIFGRITANPSLALMVQDFDVNKRSHMALGAVNVFNLWFAAVMAMGLAKLAGVSFPKAAIQVFGYWLAWEIVMIGLGFGQMAM